MSLMALIASLIPPSLCIDGGTDWFVYPTKEAYDEIKQMVQDAD